MKSRCLILTLKCVTTYTLAEVRAALSHGPERKAKRAKGAK